MTNLRFVNEDHPAACKSKICGQRPGRECIFTFRTALRFACAVFRACALRVLGTSALRAFTFLQAFASTVRNRRSATSHRAVFGGPVFRGCALRFAPCARHFSPSGLRRTATGTGMHFYPQFAIVDPHRTQSVLVALVAHWAYFGLFPPQAAASVRILNSQWSSCCA